MIIKERKLNRWQGYDYKMPSLYFVTICTKSRKDCFGQIKDDQVHLNDQGQIVMQQWLWLFEHFKYMKQDEWIIMPNHLHGIIAIVEDHFDDNIINNGEIVGTGRDLSLRRKPLPELIGAFKTTSSKLIHRIGHSDFSWQRSYHDRVIRNEKELNNIRTYIANNPVNWHNDGNNLVNNEI